MNIRPLSLLLAMLYLGACAEQKTKSAELVPIEERNVPVEKTQPAIVKAEIINDKKSKAVSKKKQPVIVALLESAKQFSNEGKSEKAAAAIERALRIEPKNALLWHHLAAVRLQQQQWQQAIVMARKSNALAVNNKQLKSDNWALIAAAYDSLGNKKKANEARNKQSGQA